ncbi:hypothetical protein ACWCXH_33705 [Kitasatospora sp. NPDC001660]
MTSEDGGLRVAFVEPAGFTDRLGRRMALTEARARLESGSCPWTLAADAYTSEGRLLPLGGEGLWSLLVRAVTAEERDARREARARARAEEQAAGQEALEAAAAARAESDRRWEAAAGRRVRSVDATELPPLAYSYRSPHHDRSHVPPEGFRPLVPVPPRRETSPGRYTGLWTSPVARQDEDGTVLDTVWSVWWRREFGGPSAGAPDVDWYGEHVRITPSADARIVLIDSADDLATLVREYPNPVDHATRDGSHLFPHWYAVSGDWDAVYLSEAGAREVCPTDPFRPPTAPHLDAWGCATVLWLQPAYTLG